MQTIRGRVSGSFLVQSSGARTDNEVPDHGQVGERWHVLGFFGKLVVFHGFSTHTFRSLVCI